MCEATLALDVYLKPPLTSDCQRRLPKPEISKTGLFWVRYRNPGVWSQMHMSTALKYMDWSKGILLLWFQITKRASCALHCIVLWKCYWNSICFDRQQISAGNWCVLKLSICWRLKSNCEIWSILAVSVWSLSFPTKSYTNGVWPPADPHPSLIPH